MGMGRDGGGGSGSGWVHSSNFYVIMRDAQGVPCLYTAGTGVLLGTVRGLALQLAPQLGLKVFQWLYASPVPCLGCFTCILEDTKIGCCNLV